jgi:DNA polymerase bacteriophage-type
MHPSDPGYHLTIDFETRSRADIKKGSWKYALDASTEIMCLAIKADDDSPMILIPPKFIEHLPADHDLPLLTPAQAAELIEHAATIEAHNAEFERAVWSAKVKHTWPELPPELPLRKLRCSAAKAAACSLPRGLDHACEVLAVPAQKDKVGYAIMKRFCAPVKSRRKVNGSWQVTESWYWNAAEYVRLCQYCMQDCNAERELSKALPNLPHDEQELWFVDQEMNARGIRVDVGAIEAMSNAVSVTENRLLSEWQKLTNYAVKSPKQVDAVIAYVQQRFGVTLPNLGKQTVIDELDEMEDGNDWLALCTDPAYRRLLELRQQLSKSSNSKLLAMQRHMCADQRIRSMLMFDGAGTGRWTAKGVQFQNFPSRDLAIDEEHYVEETEKAVDLARRGMLDVLYDEPLRVVSSCLRGMLIPDPGKRYLCADFSAIEGRVLAWLAYIQGLRMYCVAAAGIYGIPYEEIFKGRKHEPYKKMDSVGKVIELACGYQGGYNAFLNMAKGMNVDLPPEAEVRESIRKWREARPMTVALWRGLENMMFDAVASPGVMQTFGRMKAKVIGKWLMMKLPSSRFLYYFDPKIESKRMPWKDDDGNEVWKECVSYWAVDSQTKRWTKFYGYGGLWTENAVQAIARDLMANGMLKLNAAGYPIVLTVHDEVLAERTIGEGNLDEFTRLLCDIPPWAEGCPVTAAGFESRRYRK